MQKQKHYGSGKMQPGRILPLELSDRKHLSVLWGHLFHKLCEWENFTPKINKLKTLFNVWSQRDLSVYGRITIAKTLGLSKLLFSSACICIPAHVIDKVNRLIVNFVWRGKKPKSKSDTLIGSKDQGGIDLLEYETFSKSLQCAWVRRMQEGVGNQWMTIPSFYLNLNLNIVMSAKSFGTSRQL